jgi:hypothetical protein
MAGEGVNLAADLAHFAADSDSEYLKKFYVPGIRKAGDFRAAAVLNTQGPALIYNAGPQFPTEWARQAASAAGSELDLRSAAVPEAQLVAWLTSARASK